MDTAFHGNYAVASEALKRALFWDKIVRIVTLGVVNRSEHVKNAEALHYRRHRELEEYLLNRAEYAKLKECIRNCNIEGTNRTESIPLSSITAGDTDYGDDWHEVSRSIRLRDGFICQEADGSCHGPLQVHHIIPLRRGGPNSEGNLITLCEYHHSLKHPHMQNWRYQ